MGLSVMEESLFLAGFQSTAPGSLDLRLQRDHGLPVALERRLLRVALPDSPPEEMPEPPQGPVGGNLAAFDGGPWKPRPVGRLAPINRRLIRIPGQSGFPGRRSARVPHVFYVGRGDRIEGLVLDANSRAVGSRHLRSAPVTEQILDLLGGTRASRRNMHVLR